MSVVIGAAQDDGGSVASGDGPARGRRDLDRAVRPAEESLVIRPAVAADFVAIDAFDPFAGDRAREIREGRMLVAEDEGGLSGYVSWLPGGFVGRDYVTFLCVRDDRRRRGVAVALLRAVEALVGGRRLFVSTEEDNAAMLALLPREGWTAAGSVAGANEGNRAEVFFYKDLHLASPLLPERRSDPGG
jgi:GNAT superfamily N-acetyltransferase